MAEAQLPANIANMATGLVASVNNIGRTGNVQFMKMEKDGLFVFGAEGIEVEEDSLWAVHPMSFQHGWVAWGDEEHGTKNQNLGEKLGPAHEPLFPEHQLPPVEGKWSPCVALTLACTNGEDEGTQCLFKTNSYGGKQAYADLLEKVVEKIVAGDPELVPLIRLESDSYKHKTHGKIFYPVFTIVDWRTLDDVSAPGESEEEEDESAPEPEPSPQGRRRGRTQAAADKSTEEADSEEQEDEQEEEEQEEKPRRRRRRKS